MENQIRKSQEGMALLAATLFIMMAVLVLGALSVRVVSQHRHVQNYTEFRRCFSGLEAALAHAIVDLENGGDGWIGLPTWEDPDEQEIILPTFDDDGVEPMSLTTMPNVEFIAYTVHWGNDGRDNNGDGIVDSVDEQWRYTVYSLARSGSVERRTETVLRADDLNVWRNAIFAGAGQAGGLVNGNVSIHGSVHLLGSQLPPGVEAIAAIDLSGTSLIRNNYVGMLADLAQRIPAPPQRSFNGETVSTLNAKLRVRSGLVSMSGNSQVGEPDATGNDVKETMDGTYVNDGWTGNSVIADGDRGTPTKVFSDNGWNELYDVGMKVSMPMFEDDYREAYTGFRYLNPNTGQYYTHTEYFEQVLAGTPYEGDIEIRAHQDFYYNATRPNDPDPNNRQPTDSYILYNGSTKRLDINGQIQVNGNFSFSRGQTGNDRTINYVGKAALLVNGNVTINTNLLSMNPNGTTANSFPATSLLGIMAEGSMLAGGEAQLNIMGAFYAQQQIQTMRQTDIIGTFVSNFFNMGTNVPRIYQVPSLPDNLPLGMIGAYPILVFSEVSWRELG